MSSDRLKPEDLNQLAEKVVGIPQGLSRKERRKLEKYRRTHPTRTLPKVTEVRILEDVDDLLENEDVAICKQELQEYEYIGQAVKLQFDLYRIYRLIGIPESVIKESYVRGLDLNYNQGENTTLWMQASPTRVQQQWRNIKALDERGKRLNKRYQGKVAYDEDALQLAKELVRNQDVSTEDIFKELLQSNAENIELIKLQINFLTANEKTETVQELSVVEEPKTAPESGGETLKPESFAEGSSPIEEYSLRDWNLFWTNSHWSSDNNHLIPVTTTSKSEAVRSFEQISRGQISVKPSSVLRALEFHLSKNIIQRALATRNKYGPEGIREWVKIKRGKDRIFFLVIGGNKAVFFAAGRDIVYRPL